MTDPIRTRPDGSIDTAFYMARGRRARSDAAHAMFRNPDAAPRARGMAGRPVLAVLALVVVGGALPYLFV